MPKPSAKKQTAAAKAAAPVAAPAAPVQPAAPAPAPAPATPPPPPLDWRPAQDAAFARRGLYWWGENQGSFSRLPLRANGVVRPPVWDLAQCPASAQIAFRSDTQTIWIRAANRDGSHMDHMASTGSNGVQLYAGAPGSLRPWATSRMNASKGEFDQTLLGNVPAKLREYRLYLPLYKALQKLEIGLTAGARVLPPSPPRISKPVVFYGTSITQGGCASTAGSDFISTIGRMLDVEVINLGFSGNGKGEPELAQFISEIDASVYVLDYAANVSVEEQRQTLPPFVDTLRAKHPTTPILLVTNLCYAQYDYAPGSRQIQEDRRDVMIAFYAERRKAGDRNLHLADGFSLIAYGEDACYVDGVHPADHGFQLMAQRLAPALARILCVDN